MTVLLVLCGLFILYGTTIPFEVKSVEDRISIAEGWRLALEAGQERSSRTDRIANVLLFLPWGAGLAARLARAGAGLTASVLIAAFSGAALSIGVETLQINLQMRVTSIVDVMTNTTGATLGGLVGWVAASQVWPVLEPRIRLGIKTHPLAVLTLVALTGWIVVELAPFVPSLDIGQLKQSIRAARLIPFGPSIGGVQPEVDPEAVAVEVLTWVLLGGLIGLALRERGGFEGVLILSTVVLAALVRTGTELVQLIFPGHVTDATQVVLASIGAMIAACALVIRPACSPRSWAGPALVVWVLVMVLDGARPMGGIGAVGEFRATALFPFYAYFWTPPPAALTIAAEKVSSTIALGALIALRFPGMRLSLVAVVGGAFGLVIESIQLFNSARTADLTDVFLAAFGAWVGAIAIQRWGGLRSARPGPVRSGRG